MLLCRAVVSLLGSRACCSTAKFSGANADKKIFIFPVQLTTSRIGNLTLLINTLVICMTIHTYMEQPEAGCVRSILA